MLSTRSSATAEIAREVAIQGHSRSSVVVSVDAAYMTKLALNSNLTSSVNGSWDITPSLHVETLPLFQVELRKDGSEQVDTLWCQSAQNIQLSNRKRKSALACNLCTPFPDRQTDRQTDRRTDGRTSWDSF